MLGGPQLNRRANNVVQRVAHEDAMSGMQRLIAWVGWLLTLGIVALDYLGRVRELLELPGNALSLWGAMLRAIDGTTWQAVLIFVVGLSCLLVATSHVWLGWMTFRLEPIVAPSAVPLSPAPKEAYIALSNDGVLSIRECRNVASLSDTGLNQFTVQFKDEIDPDRIVCTPLGTTPRDFDVTRVTPYSADIRFKGAEEPGSVALWFHEADVTTHPR